MLRAISKIFKRNSRDPEQRHQMVRARYDAAQTTADNMRHWAAADSLGPDAAANPDVRQRLRNRARYEVANNSYAKGIGLTLANDAIGTGARLQMLTESMELNREIEHSFLEWALEVNLAEKLRTMRLALFQDGEAFAILNSNPMLEHDVKLDLLLVEADQVTSGFGMVQPDNEIDGVIFDDFGNPIAYRVLKYHPGEMRMVYTNHLNSMVIPADNMIHLYRLDRPGMHRGIPEITPALPLFAMLRRFTLATLGTAESAANFAAILYTDAPANGEADAVEPMDAIELERNMLLTMPGGWKMSQLNPAHPASTYAEFKHEILNEIARCLSLPYNIAACNSSGYNYSSGRLDHQTYYKSIQVFQDWFASRVLNRILKAWLLEYCLQQSEVLNMVYDQRLHTWFWDGMEHVDPSKEANAQQTRLENMTTNLAIEYARQGRDWESELRQVARERKLMQQLNISTQEVNPKTNPKETKEDE
jgi:lambda family phage portal protein